VAAAFQAPIGGILFTLEEGASFWSTTLTFRAFFCAMMTQLVMNLIDNGYQLGIDHADSVFAFGLFNDFEGYYTYELFIFALMGVAGGVLGAYFNYLNKHVTLFRLKHINHNVGYRMIELLSITFVMTIITFVSPFIWGECTPIPVDTADWTATQLGLLDQLVQYQCHTNYYNQVASLYFVQADTAMQQLYHFKEVQGSNFTSFTTPALLLFAIPYFFMAALTAGSLCPAGLFVPTLLAGLGLLNILYFNC
jgi:H+/Cl- antiporter ClcA